MNNDTKPRIGDTRPSSTPVTIVHRDHHRSNGKPKFVYTQAQASRLVQERPGLRFYVCSVCGGLHVGHRTS